MAGRSDGLSGAAAAVRALVEPIGALAVGRRVEAARGERLAGGADQDAARGVELEAGGGELQGDRPTTAPGRFVSLKPLVVACGVGRLELLEVQLEGRKRISAADFANGQRLTENEILGEPLH